MHLSHLGAVVILTFLFYHAPVETRKMHLSSKVLSTLCNLRKKFQETSTIQPPVKKLTPDVTVPCGWFDFCNQQGDQCETEFKSCDEATPPKKGRGVKKGKSIKKGKSVKSGKSAKRGKSIKNKKGKSAAAPGESTVPPQMSTAPPVMSTAAPDEMSTSPQDMSTAALQMSTAPPDMSTSPPDMSTAPPDMSTAAPDEMSTSPPDMSTAPPDMSKAPPQMSTSPPDVSTLPPDMSTERGRTSAAPGIGSTAPRGGDDEDCDPTTPATNGGDGTTEDDCPCRKRKKTTAAPDVTKEDEGTTPPIQIDPPVSAAPKPSGPSYTAKVYKVQAMDEAGYQALIKLETENPNLDFWSKPSLDFSTSIKVPDSEEPKVLPIFKQYKMSYKVMLLDLKKLAEEDAKKRSQHRARMAKMKGRGINKNGDITFDEFSKQEEIYTWVNKVAKDNLDVITVSSIGTTSEGRDIKMLKFAKGGETRPSVFIDAGIHAREWLAVATGTYLINELKKLAASSEETILDKINVYFVPIVNSDGYAYSWTPGNRYWRKNRRKVKEDDRCVGVDLNRNFAVEFAGAGTSDNPCSEIYRGPEAFSEAESQAVRDVIMGEKKNGLKWLAYVTIHTFGQVVLTQWGYAKDVPNDYDELKKVGQMAADAIREVHGKTYNVGGAANLLGEGAGGSDDWAKANESRGGAGIKYSYTFELRPGGGEDGNFVIDPKFIKPTGEELWVGMQTLFKFWIEEEEQSGAVAGSGSSQKFRSAKKESKKSKNKSKPPKKYQSEKKYKYANKYKKP